MTPNDNQIEQGRNDIAVLGGSKSRDSLFSSEYGLAWKIVVAHVMEGFLIDVRHINYDIGMLKIDDKTTLGSFFDPVALKDQSKLNTAKIIPVCLTAVNTDTKSKKF